MALVTPIFTYDTVTKVLSIQYAPGGPAANLGSYDPAAAFFSPALLSAQHSGSTNDSSSGSGAFVNHTTTFLIPANFMTARRVIRVTAHYQLTTGSAPPNLSHKLQVGPVVLLETGGITPAPNQTNVQTGVHWFFQATQPPSGASNVQCSAVESQNAFGITGVGITPMPVVVATNAEQALSVSTKWSAAGTGTNTISLNQFIVETLN